MILTTERLILRPWEESDAENLYKYSSSPEVGPKCGWPVHTSVEHSLLVIHGTLSAPETYAVCLKEDNKAIGSISLNMGKYCLFKTPDNEGEIGYWIGVPFWGQGLITEALREIIRHAFVDYKLEALWGGYFDGNEKSKRVLDKCGFVYHHSKENCYFGGIEEKHTVHFTLLKRDAYGK